MSAAELDYRRLLRLILSVLAALLVLAATHRTALAEGHTFILPPASGYGIADCRGEPQRCSEVVATAWCESHGYAAPIAYGKGEDMTGMIPGGKPVPPPARIDPDAFIVTCGD